jgi:hypothetical protein
MSSSWEVNKGKNNNFCCMSHLFVVDPTFPPGYFGVLRGRQVTFPSKISFISTDLQPLLGHLIQDGHPGTVPEDEAEGLLC